MEMSHCHEAKTCFVLCYIRRSLNCAYKTVDIIYTIFMYTYFIYIKLSQATYTHIYGIMYTWNCNCILLYLQFHIYMGVKNIGTVALKHSEFL